MPQPPVTLRDSPGLYRDCFTLTFSDVRTKTVHIVWHLVPAPPTGLSQPTRLLCESSPPRKLKIALRYYGKINERKPRQPIRSLSWLCASRKGFYFLFQKHAEFCRFVRQCIIHVGEERTNR